MTKYLLELIIVATATLGLVSASEFKRYFINRQQNISDFQLYSHEVAESIKNLPITTPKYEVELGIMGYEFINKVHDSIYYLNKAIINIKNESVYNKLDKVINKLSVMANEFQSKLHSSNSNSIKESLAASIDVLIEVCGDILEIVAEYHGRIPLEVSSPFQVGVHRILFAVHQLKTQAKYFKNNNKEIAAEVRNALDVFIRALRQVIFETDEIFNELIYQIIQLEHILDKTVLKLESWVQLNNQDTANVREVKRTSVEMSTMYEKLHRLANAKTFSHIVTHFSTTYQDFTVLIKNLGHLDIENNYGTQDYIRTSLLNSVSISILYNTELSLLL